MEDIILEILGEINDEIQIYQGDNLYRDGLLDSIQVVELVEQLEMVFGIEIPLEMVVLENFADKKAIVTLVEKVMEKQNAR